MTTLINFGAGPAKIPAQVLEQAQREFVVYPPAGISVTEISHRSSHFMEIIREAEGLIRELMGVSADYEVLFLQGGCSGQFSAIPLNIRDRMPSQTGVYAVTGTWSAKAAQEAAKYLTVQHPFHQKTHTAIPDISTWDVDDKAAYLYYCANETVHGVEYHFVPEHGDLPLVADVSSNILTRPFDVSKHGIVVAGVQKNLGPAGLTIGIVRKDLIGQADKSCPSVLNYREQAKMASIYNTPPVFSIYMTKLVLEWIKREGGVTVMDERNLAKSQMLYDIIDQSEGFYWCPVEAGARSRMNVPFRVGKGEAAEKRFIKGAEVRGMISLAGHRSVGGVRASLYNAVTLEETQKLADYMHEFRELENNNP